MSYVLHCCMWWSITYNLVLLQFCCCQVFSGFHCFDVPRSCKLPQSIPLVFYTEDPCSRISFFGDSLVYRNKAKSSALVLNAYFCHVCHTKRSYGHANSAKTTIFIMRDVKTYCPKKYVWNLLLFEGTVFLACCCVRSKHWQRSGGAGSEYHPHQASYLVNKNI